jgi:hypothetical protein
LGALKRNGEAEGPSVRLQIFSNSFGELGVKTLTHIPKDTWTVAVRGRLCGFDEDLPLDEQMHTYNGEPGSTFCLNVKNLNESNITWFVNYWATEFLLVQRSVRDIDAGEELLDDTVTAAAARSPPRAAGLPNQPVVVGE